jgi:hypothetical protein
MPARLPALGAAVCLAAGASLLLPACGLSSRDSKTGSALHAGDFRAPDADTIEPAAMSERGAPAYRTETFDNPRAKFTVLEGTPTLAPTVPAAHGAPAVMMDALVGDINGTPIYATTFFAPIEARLVGLAAKHRKDPQAWVAEARKIIGNQLGEMIRDELLLAEARSKLTPEQKQGLLSFIEAVRKDLVSKGGGGQAAVDEQLREQGEKGLDAKLKENIDRQLIYSNLRETVLPRANVSWHEVEVEYDKRTEKFNPDPTAVFRVIWIPTAKAELVQDFTAKLAGGASFEEQADRDENEAPGEGVHKLQFKGELAQAEIFGPKELNEAARKLRTGETTGPFTYSTYTCWIQLSTIDTPRAMPIYEAQLSIYNELRERKVKAESDKYLSNLLDRQSFTKLSEMGDKLLKIATERYYVPQ